MNEPELCEACRGTGEVADAVTLNMAIDAGDRRMEGQLFRHQCPVCHGDGYDYSNCEPLTHSSQDESAKG